MVAGDTGRQEMTAAPKAPHPDRILSDLYKQATSEEITTLERALMRDLNAEAWAAPTQPAHIRTALAAVGLDRPDVRVTYASIDSLAELTGRNRRNVILTLNSLASKGLIIRLLNAGGSSPKTRKRNRPNLYAIDLEALSMKCRNRHPIEDLEVTISSPHNESRGDDYDIYEVTISSPEHIENRSKNSLSQKSPAEQASDEQRERISVAVLKACGMLKAAAMNGSTRQRLEAMVDELIQTGATVEEIEQAPAAAKRLGWRNRLNLAMLAEHWGAIHEAIRDPYAGMGLMEAAIARLKAMDDESIDGEDVPTCPCSAAGGWILNLDGEAERRCSHSDEDKARQMPLEAIPLEEMPLEQYEGERRPKAPRVKSAAPLAASLRRYQ